MNLPDLRSILTYIRQFRGKTLVVSIDGAIIAHDNFSNIVLDLAVLQSLNIQIILVHGASHQLEKISQETQTPISNANGLGVTDKATMDLSLTVATQITHQIMERLSSSSLKACATNAVIAHPFGIVGGVDHCFTGRPERLDVGFINDLLSKNIIPIIAPLNFDGNGRTFRVNSDSLAQVVAEQVKADKLIYLTSHTGLAQNGELLHQILIGEAENYIKKYREEIPQDILSKLEHGIKACRNGINRIHIIDGRKDDALLNEIFSAEGIGTMIYADEYQAIRHAYKKDAQAIFSLIKGSIQTEEISKRTRQNILSKIDDYYVFEIDGNIMGCVALYHYPEENKAEMACLHVSRLHENQGIGKKLMLFIESIARKKNVKTLFALSTQAFNYFQQKGNFNESTSEILPSSRLKKYDEQKRNSKILAKNF